MKHIAVFLTLISLTFSTLASTQGDQINISNAQAKTLFDSFPADSEIVEPMSWGAGIYGTNYIRFSEDTECIKTDIDVEDYPNKYACYSLVSQ